MKNISGILSKISDFIRKYNHLSSYLYLLLMSQNIIFILSFEYLTQIICYRIRREKQFSCPGMKAGWSNFFSGQENSFFLWKQNCVVKAEHFSAGIRLYLSFSNVHRIHFIFFHHFIVKIYFLLHLHQPIRIRVKRNT